MGLDQTKKLVYSKGHHQQNKKASYSMGDYIQKMGREFEHTLLQRNSDGQKAHKRMLHITNYKGNANKNHNEISPHTS